MNAFQCDAIVAGAGIWGCTVARRLAEAGRKVLVLEKRPAVGGNCRCETDPETGIEVHTYGSHIFHTSNEEVWNFVNRFTRFNDYRHCVLARFKGRTYHLPIGCTLLKEFFGRELKPSALNDSDRQALFDAFIRGYTSKQWGVPPEKVDPSIIARLKVRDNYSTDYFDDPHQGIPCAGYNRLFEKLLEHPNIIVMTSTSLKAEFEHGDCRLIVVDEPTQRESPIGQGDAKRQLFYSGPIDALFDYRFGALPWRTLRFERETLPVVDYQGNSVVNYTEAEVPYTRIHEFSHYHPESNGVLVSQPRSSTVIMREYSATWHEGDEPYYPIDNPESRALLAKYRECSAAIPGVDLILGGRLGQYRYYDMDRSIESALKTADEALSRLQG